MSYFKLNLLTMEFFTDSIYFIWFLVGTAFFIGEFILPGFILAFFGLGAFIVSLVLYFYSEFSFDNQILLFAVSSLILLFSLRSYVKKIFTGQERVDEDEYFGNDQFKESSKESFGVVVGKLPSKGFGKIKYRGTFYKAKSISNEAMIDGENVKVIDTLKDDKSVYIVEKI